MKVKVVLFLLAIAVIIPACNKNFIAVFTGAKIQTVTDFVHQTISTYTYNTADGSISTIQQNSGGKTTYTYPNDTTILMQFFNSAGVLTSATLYMLNGKKLADSSKGELQVQNLSAAYEYDGNGMLVKQKNYVFGNLSSTLDYSITSKNVFIIVNTNAASNSQSSHLDYFSANINTTGNQNMGQDFLGVQSTNLLRINVQIGQNGDTSDIITYRYRFDANSNVDTMASYHRNGQMIDSMAFSYY